MTKQANASDLMVVAEGIRLVTLQTFLHLGSGHIGGSMSVVETLAALYGGELRCDPENPKWEERDRLIMSKGHAGPALYATLCLRGFFPKDMLLELNRGGGRLPSHCDMNKTPGIDMTTGSLGQGLSAAAGVALGCRLNGLGSITYAILGDGECDEGQVWEAAMFAAHYKLNNLIAFIDNNKQQLDGYTKEVMDLGNIGEKFRAFGWQVQEVPGHEPGGILEAIIRAKEEERKPSVIVLDTIKGHGCTFAEGTANHHMSFTQEQMEKAIEQVVQRLEQLRAALGESTQ